MFNKINSQLNQKQIVKHEQQFPNPPETEHVDVTHKQT